MYIEGCRRLRSEVIVPILPQDSEVYSFFSCLYYPLSILRLRPYSLAVTYLAHLDYNYESKLVITLV